MLSTGRLVSVIEHLARVHGPETSLQERMGVLQASISVILPNNGVRTLIADLFEFCKQTHQDSKEAVALEAAAAAVLLCKFSLSDGPLMLEEMLEYATLPVLMSTNPSLLPHQQNLTDCLFALLAMHKRWDLILSLLQRCGEDLNAQKTILGESEEQDSPSHSDKPVLVETEAEREVLPLHCILLLTKEGLQSLQAHVQDIASSNLMPDAVAQLDKLFEAFSKTLSSESPVHQRASSQILLPGLLESSAAFESAGVYDGLSARQNLLSLVMSLLEADSGRAISLMLLLQRASELLSGMGEDSQRALIASVKSCLASVEPANQKRAFLLLQRLAPEISWSETPWSSFLTLFSLLDEFAPHLIQGAWQDQIGGLMLALKHGSDRPLAFDASWMILLWEKGLRHSNLQVQKLVLDSILTTDWTAETISALPPEFVLGSLLRAVTHCIPAKGYVEWLEDKFGTFIHSYVEQGSHQRQWTVIATMFEEAGHPGRQRIAVQQLLSALASAVSASGPLFGLCLDENELHSRATKIVSCMSGVLDNLECFVGADFQLAQTKGLLGVVISLLTCGSVPVSLVASCLELLPLRHLQSGGSLSFQVKDWLQHNDWFSNGLGEVYEAYFLPRSPHVVNLPASGHELQGWQQAASRLAKLLIFADQDSKAVKEIFESLETKISQIYNRPYLAQGTAERTFLLILAILEVATPATTNPDSESANTTNLELSSHISSLFKSAHQDLDAYTRAAVGSFWSPLTTSGDTLAAQTPEANGTAHVPQQFGARAQRLAPHIAAALTRAKLALTCSAQGALFNTTGAKAEKEGSKAAKRQGSSLLTSPSSLSSSMRRWSSGFDFESSLAGRRRSGSEASTSGSPQESFNAVVRFLQQCTSTPLPSPSSNSSASKIQAYGEVRYDALLGIAAALTPLAKASRRQPGFAKWLAREIKLEKILAVINETQGEGDSRQLEIARWQAVEAVLDLMRTCSCPLPNASLADTLLRLMDRISSSNESALPHILSCQRCLVEEALQNAKLLSQVAEGLGASGSSGESAKTAALFSTMLQADWAALQDIQKRTVTSLCSFLHAVLAPPAFACTSKDDPRWQLHTDEGAMRLFVLRLLEEAKRSIRMMSLFSLQLVKVLTSNPAVLPLYVDVYQELLLFNKWPCDQPEAICQEKFLGNNGDLSVAGQVLGLLDGSDYQGYKYTSLAGRVAAAYGLALLAGLAEDTANPLSKDAALAGKCLWERMYETACTHHKQHQGKRMVHNLDEQGRLRLRIWQATCCCAYFAPSQDLQPLIASLFEMLQMELLGPVKAAKEIILTFLFKRQKDLIWSYLIPRLSDYSQHVSRVDSLPSAILIAAQLLFDASPDHQEALLRPLVTSIVPWAMLHHQSIRAYSQVVMQAILRRFPQVLDEEASDELLSVAAFLENSPSMQKLQGLKSIALREVSPETARGPANVFSEEGLPAGKEDAVAAREAAPVSLLDVVQDFLIGERANLRQLAKLDIDGQDTVLPEGSLTNDSKQADLQRKIQPLQHGLEGTISSAVEDIFVQALPDDSARAMMSRQKASNRQNIIVVASLLDRVPNLAGLTRTCEVFKAEALAMADLSVTKQSEFAGISVTAEKHIPLLEVKPERLANWLLEKKQEGYAILGLEQTSEALPLPDYKFSKRTVMVLGREREGIPAELLHILDRALVIPQLGLIRSLNAHVSGSIALYEYTKCFLE